MVSLLLAWTNCPIDCQCGRWFQTPWHSCAYSVKVAHRTRPVSDKVNAAHGTTALLSYRVMCSNLTRFDYHKLNHSKMKLQLDMNWGWTNIVKWVLGPDSPLSSTLDSANYNSPVVLWESPSERVIGHREKLFCVFKLVAGQHVTHIFEIWIFP